MRTSTMRWKDKQRDTIQALNYLCRVTEAKNWIEECLDTNLGPISTFEQSLRNGVVLAKLVLRFQPFRRFRVFESDELQFRHSDNINKFLDFIADIKLPEIFHFELTDIYEGKNLPKVIYCIHALSFFLSMQNLAPPLVRINENLNFADDDVAQIVRRLQQSNAILPNFTALSSDFMLRASPTLSPTRNPAASPKHSRARSQDLSDSGSAFSSPLTSPLKYKEEDTRSPLSSSTSHRRTKSSLPSLNSFKSSTPALSSSSKLNGFEDSFLQPPSSSLRDSPSPSFFTTFSPNRRREALFSYYNPYHQLERAPFQDNVLNGVQACCRGVIARIKLVDVLQSLAEQSTHVETFQAMIRGYLSRSTYKINENAYEEMVRWTESLQSSIRGHLVRVEYKEKVLRNESLRSVPKMQAVIRAGFYRRSQVAILERLKEKESSFILIQSSSHGYLTRHQIVNMLDNLYHYIPSIIQLQSVIRGALFRNRLKQLSRELDSFPYRFHAMCRGFFLRRRLNNLKSSLESQSSSFTSLSTLSRGCLLRSIYKGHLKQLHYLSPSLIPLQSICRGLLSQRWQLNILEELYSHTASVTTLQSFIRGFLTRISVAKLNIHLVKHSRDILFVQSAVRAVLLRDDVNFIEIQLESSIDETLALQSTIRGCLARSNFARKLQSFHQKMENPIIAKSVYRGRQEGLAYRELATARNPPVMTVKNFVHLLDDNNFDFEEDVCIENMRKEIVKLVRENETIEEHINELDVKIALLVKNKISLDDVLKHHNKYKPGKQVSDYIANSRSMKTLNNSSRRYLDLVQCFFYVLQTNEIYITNYLHILNKSNPSFMQLRHITYLILQIFGHASNRREEVLFLRLMTNVLNMEVSQAETTEDILNNESIWKILLMGLLGNIRDAKLWKSILSRMHKILVYDERMDFEINPVALLKQFEPNRKDHSENPKVALNIAMQHSPTRNLYVGRLRELRKLCQSFIIALSRNIESFPFSLCYVASQLKLSLEQNFPSARKEWVFGIIGRFVFDNYIKPLLISPDNYKLVEGHINALQRKNLNCFSDILSEIFSVEPRDSRQLGFLRPLSEFIEVSKQDIVIFLEHLTDVVDPETYFEFDVFEDIVSTKRPVIYMKRDDILNIYTQISRASDLIATDSPNDPLRAVISELESTSPKDDEFLESETDIKLELSPRFCTVEDPVAEERSLIVQTKRYIFFIIRVQNGTSLMDILVKPVTDEDEETWRELLVAEAERNQRFEAFDDTLSSSSFAELKYLALTNVLELENLGFANRSNNYQDIVNSIALDIRNKSKRRLQRQRELDFGRQNLVSLKDKRAFLDSQLKSYNEYIEQAMETLQSKKGKKKLIPFSKQYFHMRELRKSGRVPRFGSFKYTATKLYDRGILVSMSHMPHHDKLYITISADEVGKFTLEASSNAVQVTSPRCELQLDDLLSAQYNKVLTIDVLEGRLKFNTNMFLHLIFSRFYS
ncbi:IQGAP domain cytoskeleton scaffold protein Rng2 [Schizosaccharomyces osmophilus]|uniref:IQGAP domain cytoskeleton scaffold protein Rng2 n=1 Tax=Schizosaccharomyces osmophilus TaxID=2545709 RepID=A0AAE9WG59_9SCHI|nr:IQGAP domain cytoskeleton scaffold protein Rng2 [Schizosaccharomyces osmophilus]WBW74607.1 IQGAP domain cytoskeleton scaffold protein Rng2 [Schizosaccharomyces osmophilus]